MQNVEVSEVELFPLDPDRVARFSLESPMPGSGWESFSLPFTGWIVGRQERIVALELAGPGLNVRLPVAVSRPEIAETHPELRDVDQPCGFRVDVSALGLPSPFAFTVSAVLKGNSQLGIARVHGSRRPLPTGHSRMKPILVTSLGRTGSTLVMKLLSLHPEIAAYPLFRTELKVASYWTDIMLALTDPRSYLQPARTMIRGPNWWLGEKRLVEEDFDDPELRQWLGTSQMAEVARFCRERIEEFYERLTDAEKPQTFFAEKCMPREPSYATLLTEMFSDIREIILVRDFRDTLCSIFAWNERFGTRVFGRELADTDEDYIRGNLAAQVRLLTSGWKQRLQSAFLLKYEDLILEPRRTLESLLQYLGVDSSDAILEKLDEGFSFSRTHGTSLNARESIGRWKTDLDPALVSACEEAFAEAIETFGYSDRELMETI